MRDVGGATPAAGRLEFVDSLRGFGVVFPPGRVGGRGVSEWLNRLGIGSTDAHVRIIELD
jgi:hypothetical protein